MYRYKSYWRPTQRDPVSAKSLKVSSQTKSKINVSANFVIKQLIVVLTSPLNMVWEWGGLNQSVQQTILNKPQNVTGVWFGGGVVLRVLM